MNPDSEHTNRKRFLELISAAKKGNAAPLNQFLKRLYQSKRHSLVRLTQSEAEAEECFQAAVAKFWIKCVEGGKQLPAVNIEGYIYRMAQFYCIDQKRKQSSRKVESKNVLNLENDEHVSEDMRIEMEVLEEERLFELKKAALQKAIKKLSTNCQRLYKAEQDGEMKNIEELQTILGFKEKRRVSVLRYECKERLKVLAAAEYERLRKND